MGKGVLLGMSGGTDSSVAALLLQEQGYEVTGITFRFHEDEGDTAYLDDAREVAAQLGIRHLTYDAREVFRQTVEDYFVREYLAGRTPVPCTLCNNLLKWPLLCRVADREDIPHVATGHYVRTVTDGGLHYIVRGADPDKDQSFFLWGLPQEVIRRMVLPMGGRTKAEVRRLAAERGLRKAAVKRDSLGVCFCPMDYREFLKRHVADGTIRPGFFYDGEGKVIGRHEGYPFYTVGQRRGLGVYLNKALFVKEICPSENRIVLSDNLQALEKSGMYLKDWNVPNPSALFGREDVIVKIRYRKQANRCTVRPADNGLLHVELHEPLASVALGQAAAFYREDVVLGGGIIEEAY